MRSRAAKQTMRCGRLSHSGPHIVAHVSLIRRSSFGLGFLLALLAACNGGGPATPPTPEDGIESPPSAWSPERRTYRPGAVIAEQTGILFVELSTGAAELWTMPTSYATGPISPDGRWVSWGSVGEQHGSAAGGRLLDTRTGTDRAMDVDGEPAAVSAFSSDGERMVSTTATRVMLLETDSLRVLAEVRRPGPNMVGNGGAEFSATGAAAAAFIGRDGDPGSQVTVVLWPDERSAQIEGAGWPLQWSGRGTRLALTTVDGTRLVDVDGVVRERVAIDASGGNPRWSPSDRYLALANPGDVGGARVFDTADGTEVLRTVGSPTCVGDYWNVDGTLQFGWEGDRVAVPEGSVLPPDPAVNTEPAVEFNASRDGLQVLLDRSVVATLSLQTEFLTSYYDEDGSHPLTTDGRLLILLGSARGGRGLCDGDLPEPDVILPPFD